MRLIDAETLELKYFAREQDHPEYAILSHVWGTEEVTFQEMNGDRSLLTGRGGFEKIVGCSVQALSEGIRYIWVDTCCIDKTSSSELSEAINSMFRWYREAIVCYAYLEDVLKRDNPASQDSMFRRSRWFARGWTLHELLAPYEVVFFACNWRDLGTKHILHKVVSEITNIDKESLLGCTWDHVSIAGVMSWASRRSTTRIEDQAYCLMGIFQVNMPLIYGEGIKAFYRLQMEIMKYSNDESIFAWAPASAPQESVSLRRKIPLGLLATSPAAFQEFHDIRTSSASHQTGTAYDTEKQHIRLSTQIVSLRKLSTNDRVWLKTNNTMLVGEVYLRNNDFEDITRGITKGLIITPTKDADFENFQEVCLLAVLQCEDKDGCVALPVQALPSGEYERVAIDLAYWYTSYRVRWKPTYVVPGVGAHYELKAALSAGRDSSLPGLSTLNRTILIRAEARTRARLQTRHQLLREQEIRLDMQSFTSPDTDYYLTSTYPQNLTLSSHLGITPTGTTITEMLRKARGDVKVIILFIRNRSPRADLPSFAIRLQLPKLNSDYQIAYLIGPSVDVWSSRSDPPESSSFTYVPSGAESGYTEAALANDKTIVFRPRQGRPESPGFISISIAHR